MSLKKVCDNCPVVDNKDIKRWYHVVVKPSITIGKDAESAMEADFCSVDCAVQGITNIEKMYK
jgi:hypothetical protein